jgi:predicted nucleotidyltransferase component of viral defense system
MAEYLYPLRLGELVTWQKRWGVTVDEARKRFVQFVVLESIAADSELRDRLSFKGGNALRFVYGSPRSTVDLDFTASALLPDDADRIRAFLDRAMDRGGRTFGIKLKCQRVERKPPKNKGTMPTYAVAVGFQFPEDRGYANFESSPRPVVTVVKIEISLNDVVCETLTKQLSPEHPAQIRACTLEDILAEKLRALLQQVARNRTRPQDAFDIARMYREHEKSLDLAKIAAFLQKKCLARSISVSRRAFADEEVRRRAAFEYEKLLAISQTDPIPFDEAWQIVSQLVSKLALPE